MLMLSKISQYLEKLRKKCLMDDGVLFCLRVYVDVCSGVQLSGPMSL